MWRPARGARAVAALAALAIAVLATALIAACGSSFTLPTNPGSHSLKTATPIPSSPPAPYLALGDSVAFGFVAHPPPPPGGGDAFRNAANFVGYPTFVANTLDLNGTNASCPGETSASFIDRKAADNGCELYRASNPLHVSYADQSQLQFAGAFLKSHPTTELVTLDLGANDGLIAVQKCGGVANAACLDPQIQPTLTTLTTNLTTIVQSLRGAGFNGTLVLVNFYSFNYANAEETQLVSQLNSVIATVATANHLQLADAFAAFKQAANRTGGDACATGLLASGSSLLGSCDLHPSLSGQQLLATTVADAAVK